MNTLRNTVFASNRSFGWTVTGLCTMLGAWSAWTDGYMFVPWFTLVAVVAALTVFAEDSLESPRQASEQLAEKLAPRVSRMADAAAAYLRKPRGRYRRAQ
jgi:hypothetical protein